MKQKQYALSGFISKIMAGTDCFMSPACLKRCVSSHRVSSLHQVHQKSQNPQHHLCCTQKKTQLLASTWLLKVFHQRKKKSWMLNQIDEVARLTCTPANCLQKQGPKSVWVEKTWKKPTVIIPFTVSLSNWQTHFNSQSELVSVRQQDFSPHKPVQSHFGLL